MGTRQSERGEGMNLQQRHQIGVLIEDYNEKFLLLAFENSLGLEDRIEKAAKECGQAKAAVYNFLDALTQSPFAEPKEVKA